MYVTAEQVVDFLHCPLYYQFRYVDKVPVTSSVRALFEKTLRSTINYFFIYTMDGCFPTLKSLRDVWARQWFPENISTNEIMWRDYNKERMYEQLAIETLTEVWRKETKKQFKTIAVGQEFEVIVGNHVLSCRIDLIRDIDHKVQVVNFFPGKITSGNNADYDILLTMYSFVFRSVFGHKEDTLVRYYLTSCYESVTSRNVTHYRGLKGILDRMTAITEQGLYYPLIQAQCATCCYLKKCRKWPYNS